MEVLTLLEAGEVSIRTEGVIVPSAGSVFDERAARQLEVLYRTPDIVEQRRQTRSLLAPRPGERILDAGSGPGLLVAELAEDVGPSGHVTGIDIADAMIARSQQRAATSPLADRMTFLKANATALPFDDHTFDAAVSVQVYEYVDDVDTALAELYRVLRPGGRAVILDTDWDSVVWNATDTDLMRRVLAAWATRFAHPHLPRTLSRRLQHAGFAIDDRLAFTILNPDYAANTYSAAHLDFISDFITSHGPLAPAEVNAWRNDVQALARDSAYFFSLNRYVFLTHKPR